MVNYYRDMWPQRSHLLAPLSSLTSVKVRWKWTPEHQKSFEQMKALIAKETLLTYPDFSKEFEFIRMQVNYSLVPVSHKKRNLLHFILGNYNLLKPGILPQKENYYP